MFELIFLKEERSLEENEKQLKEQLIDYIHQQIGTYEGEKMLSVLQTFTKYNEEQRNTERLLEIVYLYESAGMFVQSQKLRYRIWDIIC